jgi:hypothetical protein
LLEAVAVADGLLLAAVQVDIELLPVLPVVVPVQNRHLH